MKAFLYADGYVRIKIWGSGTTRFLGLCAHKQMPFWDIKADGKYVYANMKLRDFFQCKKLVHKAGVKAVVIERHGLPFFISQIWKRSFFVIGFLVFTAAWLVTTNMLLHIRLEGNYSISEDVFMDFLDTQGIHIGMWKKDIPIEELEKEIRKHFDIVTWTSGRLKGTILSISIKENEKLTPTKEDTLLSNGSSIYATADGIVTSIYVRNGIPMVKKGAEVRQGDLLVDGKVPIYDENQELSGYQYYQADADIMIETLYPVSLTLDKVYTQKTYTGRNTKGYYFSVGQKIYRNTWNDRDFIYKDYLLEEKQHWKTGKIQIGIGLFEVKEYMITEKEYSPEEAKNLLEQEFQENNAILVQKGVQILEKNVTIDVIMDGWALTGSMKVNMPAFTHKPIWKEDDHDSEGL